MCVDGPGLATICRLTCLTSLLLVGVGGLLEGVGGSLLPLPSSLRHVTLGMDADCDEQRAAACQRALAAMRSQAGGLSRECVVSVY
jgi:hypothetical protein